MITLSIDRVAAPKFKQNLAGLGDRMQTAMATAANMAASMIETAAKADIAGAGNFGGSWISGLHVNVEGGLGNMRISMTHDDFRVGVFEEGATIQGHPLLWIPLSFSDAVGIRAADYGGGLFRVDRTSGGPPLLLSISDKQPKYFGVTSVTLPQKFHLREVQAKVMENFATYFQAAFQG